MNVSSQISPEVEAARQAGLVYVTDQKPGISRLRTKTGFRYIDAGGKPVHDQETLARIKSLVIPPNWENVWICSNPRGHLQAVGRDFKGRKQYRYHPRYRAAREETKYNKMALFGSLLPTIRKRVDHDLSLPGLPKEKVLATVVRLMDLAHLRVGNEEYARENKSYGLTTMHDRHVRIEGSKLQFSFRGKSGIHHQIVLDSPRLASIVKRCRDLPGYELFQYIDENGDHRAIESGMVNDYLREITGADITAKDFRTWHGTISAAMELGKCGACSSDAEIKRNIVAAIKVVSERLGNRPATCRKYYVHPLLLELYSKSMLTEQMVTVTTRETTQSLTPTEMCVLKLITDNTLNSPTST